MSSEEIKPDPQYTLRLKAHPPHWYDLISNKMSMEWYNDYLTASKRELAMGGTTVTVEDLEYFHKEVEEAKKRAEKNWFMLTHQGDDMTEGDDKNYPYEQ